MQQCQLRSNLISKISSRILYEVERPSLLKNWGCYLENILKIWLSKSNFWKWSTNFLGNELPAPLMFRLFYIKTMGAIFGVEDRSSVKGYHLILNLFYQALKLFYIYFQCILLFQCRKNYLFTNLHTLKLQNKQNINVIICIKEILTAAHCLINDRCVRPLNNFNVTFL